MSANRAVAGILMKEAWETINKKRPGVHGSAEQSFEMIADLWTVYLRHIYKTRGVAQLRPEDVAEMMSMLKKARKVYGDPLNHDNDVDDIGYTGFAGMLRLPDITKQKEDQLEDAIDNMDVELQPDQKSEREHEHVWGPGPAPDEEACVVEGCDARRMKPKSKPRAGK